MAVGIVLSVLLCSALVTLGDKGASSGQDGDLTCKGFPSSRSFQKQEGILLMRSATKAGLLPGDSVLVALPHALTTFVRTAGKTTLSLRQFLSRYSQDTDLYLDGVIIDTFKALLPLPEVLQCPFFVSNLLSSSMFWRWADEEEIKREVNGMDRNALHCVLDGRGKFSWSEKDQKEKVLDLSSGDCLYLPPKQSGSLVLRGRAVMIAVTWSGEHPSSQRCPKDSQVKDKILADLTFKEDPTPDILELFTLNLLTTFLEENHLKPNCTLEAFQKRFEKMHLKKMQNWNDECQEVANQLFQEMDVNQDGVLSVADVEDSSLEDLRHLAGVLEDRLADIADIAGDQEEDKPKKSSGPVAMAEEMKEDYEKELQAILEQGFNEILQEANIKGKVSFDKDGKPRVTKTEDNELPSKKSSSKEEL